MNVVWLSQKHAQCVFIIVSYQAAHTNNKLLMAPFILMFLCALFCRQIFYYFWVYLESMNAD